MFACGRASHRQLLPRSWEGGWHSRTPQTINLCRVLWGAPHQSSIRSMLTSITSSLAYLRGPGLPPLRRPPPNTPSNGVPAGTEECTAGGAALGEGPAGGGARPACLASPGSAGSVRPLSHRQAGHSCPAVGLQRAPPPPAGRAPTHRKRGLPAAAAAPPRTRGTAAAARAPPGRSGSCCGGGVRGGGSEGTWSIPVIFFI